jgi:hypothetical protein
VVGFGFDEFGEFGGGTELGLCRRELGYEVADGFGAF